MGQPWRYRIVVLVLFIAFLNLFLFHWFGSIAFALVAIGFFLFFLGLFLEPRQWRQQQWVVFGTSGLLLALFTLLVHRDSGFVEDVLGFGVVAALVVFLYLVASKIPFVRSLLELVFVPFSLGWSYVIAALRVIGVLTSSDTFRPDVTRKISRFKPILVGLAIAIPVVVVLTLMFAGADPIYRTYLDEWIQKWTSLEISERIKIRILFSVGCLAVLSPLLLLRRSSEFRSPLAGIRFSFHREMTVVMLAIALVLGSFLVVQWPYVFVTVPAETGLSKFGVATYSEYVKRGFTELLTIALFLYALIWTGLLFVRQAGYRSRSLLAAQLLVLVEFAVFLTSIARRVWLYQLYHGLTLGRIYGTFLLIWIAIMTTTLLLRHIWRWRFVVAEIAATIGVVLVVGLFNAEKFIAVHRPPTVNHHVDHVYLSQMSSDGTDGWKRAYQYASEVLTGRGYETKALLDREDRREIAYAAVIISYLTQHHHDLVYRYGTDDDVRAFTLDALSFFNDLIESERRKTSEREQSVRGANEDDRLRQQRFQDRQNRLMSVLSSVSAASSQALASPVVDRRRTMAVTHDFKPPFHQFQSPCVMLDQEPTCLNFLRWGGVEDLLPLQGWVDFLLSWNGSQERAYQFMKRDIPIGDLIRLYRQYIVLHEKIAAQPPEEQDYDIDISFATPFLGM